MPDGATLIRPTGTCSARFDCRMALRLSGLRVHMLHAVVGRIRRQPPSDTKKAPEGAFFYCAAIYAFFSTSLTISTASFSISLRCSSPRKLSQ
ncbi:hypothetical protein EH164_15780 [Kosakonia sp. CCTCC M2018092]|nr:hypothetical protein EH164_15780 [Kosakonia sp. CCTCC M2018092]